MAEVQEEYERAKAEKASKRSAGAVGCLGAGRMYLRSEAKEPRPEVSFGSERDHFSLWQCTSTNRQTRAQNAKCRRNMR